MKPAQKYWLLSLLLLGYSALADPVVFTANSGNKQTALLELYTSQGCSSCPPAEKWLGQLEGHGLDTDSVIPMALHVDYWDYIGWKDYFAKAEHTERQRRTGSLNRLNTIYTPQFVLNGKDLRPARKIAQRLAKINQQTAPIKIILSASFSDSDSLDVSWHTDPALPESASLYLVITENNLQTKINAGENSGRMLDHQHVVRSMKKISADSAEASVSIPIPSQSKREHLDLLAFVEEENGQILQTLKLPLR